MPKTGDIVGIGAGDIIGIASGDITGIAEGDIFSFGTDDITPSGGQVNVDDAGIAWVSGNGGTRQSDPLLHEYSFLLEVVGVSPAGSGRDDGWCQGLNANATFVPVESIHALYDRTSISAQ